MKLVLLKGWMPSEKQFTDIQLEIINLADLIKEMKSAKFPSDFEDIVDNYQYILDSVEKLVDMVFPPEK